MYLVTAEEMREMDRRTIEEFGLAGEILMENAGRGAARILEEAFGPVENKKIGIAAGRGNNGGDGFVIARYLADRGALVTVFLLSEKKRVAGDAEKNLRLLDTLAIPVIEIPDSESFSKQQTRLKHQTIWVDAILGTGLTSDVRDYMKHVIDFLNGSNLPILSVDIPSGLHSDTAQPCGTCIRAHTTVTFGYPKVGHLLFPGAGYVGKLEVIDIGIPLSVSGAIAPLQKLIQPEDARTHLESRPQDAHKGHTGHLLVVAGSVGKTGAAAMTALSAMRSGAGLVTLGVPEGLNHVMETLALEVMTTPLHETPEGFLAEAAYDPIISLLEGKKCLALGPGIGTSQDTRNLVNRLVAGCPIPMVIDADGLNCLQGTTGSLSKTDTLKVLTPHPGEMARLLDKTPASVQKNRVQCARDFANRFNVCLLLKGARTVVAEPSGRVWVNPTGNSGMASGGMGDVLTGIIGGLIAQGIPAYSAAVTGAYLHGLSADRLLADKGPYGFLASDVMDELPGSIRQLLFDTETLPRLSSHL